jgi:hypothetical protein
LFTVFSLIILNHYNYFNWFQKTRKETSHKNAEESDMNRLKQAAMKLNYDIVQTKAHGDCMFLALAEQLGMPGSGTELRRNLISHLLCNPDIVGNVDFEAEGTSFHDYVDRMSKPGVWGDGIMLEVAVNLFQRPISVLQPNGCEISLTSPQIPADAVPLRLAYVSISGSGPGNHYVSLISKRNISVQDS